MTLEAFLISLVLFFLVLAVAVKAWEKLERKKG